MATRSGRKADFVSIFGLHVAVRRTVNVMTSQLSCNRKRNE